MDNVEQITVEVCYAHPEKQELVQLRIESGATLKQAIEESGILARVPAIGLDKNKVGVFGKICSLDRVLREGDRVEIYRPLIADPKELRRQRAAAECK